MFFAEDESRSQQENLMKNFTFEHAELLAPVFTRDGSGQPIDLGDHRGTIIVSAAQTNNAFSLIDLITDFESGPPMHIHKEEDETFFIRTGRFAITVGDESFIVGPGDTTFAPRGIPHTWRCLSPEGGNVLLLVTPGPDFEGFAIEMSEHDIFPLTPESLPIIIGLCDKYGMELLPPAN